MEILYKAGHIFRDPETDQGYRMSRDIHCTDLIMSTDFIPVDGTPQPKAGDLIPSWLVKQIRIYP